jgi:hypothetical protein
MRSEGIIQPPHTWTPIERIAGIGLAAFDFNPVVDTADFFKVLINYDNITAHDLFMQVNGSAGAVYNQSRHFCGEAGGVSTHVCDDREIQNEWQLDSGGVASYHTGELLIMAGKLNGQENPFFHSTLFEYGSGDNFGRTDCAGFASLAFMYITRIRIYCSAGTMAGQAILSKCEMPGI